MNFKAFQDTFDEPACIKDFRKRAFKCFEESETPSFKHGLNISLRPKSKPSLKPEAHPKATVTIDTFDQEGIRFFQGRDIGEDITGEGEQRIKLFTTKTWKTPTEAEQLYTFNQAFTNNFLLLHLTKTINKPIIMKINAATTLNTTIFIHVEKDVKATFLLRKEGNPDYNGEETRILAEPHAHITFAALQTFSENTMQVINRQSIAKKGSEVHFVDASVGSQFTKANITSLLEGQGSSSTNTAVYLARNDQRLDLSTDSIHLAANTSSDIVTKGVINDQAKALSRGLVRINKQASESNGYETQDALLLSDKAEADAIPNLEIYNPDVKCSHGSTVGQLDTDLLFYLMSRGLNKKQAIQKIVEGYFTPIYSKFKDESLTENVQKAVLEAMA